MEKKSNASYRERLLILSRLWMEKVCCTIHCSLTFTIGSVIFRDVVLVGRESREIFPQVIVFHFKEGVDTRPYLESLWQPAARVMLFFSTVLFFLLPFLLSTFLSTLFFFYEPNDPPSWALNHNPLFHFTVHLLRV